MSDISKVKLPNNTTYNIKDSGASRIGHTHNESEIWGVSYQNGTNYLRMPPKVSTTRANRLAFLPADQIIIEKTTDGGNTWVSAEVSDTNKRHLFAETRGFSLGIPLLNGVKNTLCGVRITITAMKYNVPEGTAETQKYNYWNSTYVKSTERYCTLDDLYFWVNAVQERIGVKVERANGNTPNTWVTAFNEPSWGMTGWSGSDCIRIGGNVFGGSTGQTTQPWNYRLTFMTVPPSGATTLTGGTYAASQQTLVEIRGYGTNIWTVPNEYAANDKLYTIDINKNATFPNNVVGNNIKSKGSSTQPIYFDANGVAQNTTYTLSKSVPSDAVFTDTKSDWNATSGNAQILNKPTLATVATSGSYTDLSNKPTIPSVVTESTVSGWGFTKNTGTYSKPSTGIPKTDLASAVQTSLGKADTALQSYTETDPVFVASAAHGITSTDISNWNSKGTSNLALGETSTTAYRGDRGKVAYDHSQSAHAPSDAQKNVQADWTQTTTTADDYIKNKPTLAAVATSGSYTDLSNKPTIDTSLSSTSTNAVQNKTINSALSGKVPTTRTVNGKALSSNITLTASDVGAAASSHTHIPADIQKKYILIGDSWAAGDWDGNTTYQDGWTKWFCEELGLTNGTDVFIAQCSGTGFTSRSDMNLSAHSSFSNDGINGFLTLLRSISINLTASQKKTLFNNSSGTNNRGAMSTYLNPTNNNTITDIIVCGGLNDANNSESEATLKTNIDAFLTYARTTYPNATVHLGMLGRACMNSASVINNLVIKVYPAYSTAKCHFIKGIQNLGHDYGRYANNFHPTMDYIEEMGREIARNYESGISVGIGTKTTTITTSDNRSATLMQWQIDDTITIQLNGGLWKMSGLASTPNTSESIHKWYDNNFATIPSTNRLIAGNGTWNLKLNGFMGVSSTPTGGVTFYPTVFNGLFESDSSGVVTLKLCVPAILPAQGGWPDTTYIRQIALNTQMISIPAMFC